MILNNNYFVLIFMTYYISYTFKELSVRSKITNIHKTRLVFMPKADRFPTNRTMLFISTVGRNPLRKDHVLRRSLSRTSLPMTTIVKDCISNH